MRGSAAPSGPDGSRPRVNLPEGLIALLHQPSLCFLTTLMPGGSPADDPDLSGHRRRGRGQVRVILTISADRIRGVG